MARSWPETKPPSPGNKRKNLFPCASPTPFLETSHPLAILKKLFQHLLVLLGCLHLAGGPYSIMQCYAWVGMLVSYSQEDGLVQAAVDTFSGEKPCELCHKIADVKESDPDTKDPVIPPSLPFSGKILQEMLPARLTFLAPPRGTELPPIRFAGIQLPAAFPKASPPVPPPCRVA